MVNTDITRYQERIGCSIDHLAADIKNVLHQVVKNSIVYYRIKNLETLHQKMILKNTTDISRIDDIFGLRVVVDSIEDIYMWPIEKSFRSIQDFWITTT